jgi:hypothetical protein
MSKSGGQGMADPAPGESTAERSIGRATAVAILAPIAERMAARQAQEEREEREEAEAKRRAEKRARRAEARARLTLSARRELGLLAIWVVAWAIVMMSASLPLTFLTSEASAGSVLNAAFQYLWKSVLIGGVAMLCVGWAYDAFRAARGKMAWSAAGTSQIDLFLFTLAVVGVFVYSASREGAVPPSAWTAAPFTVMTSFIVVLGLRLAAERIARPSPRKLVVLLGCIVTLGIAWLVAPKSDIPSRASQRTVDRRLQAAVPMSHCSSRPIGALPVSLLRNSLDGLVRCHQGGIRGKFLAFSNSHLLAISESQRKNEIEGRSEDPVEPCSRHAGVYVSTWHKGNHNNQPQGGLFCYGHGNGSVLVWVIERSDLLAELTGRPRGRLYHWWHKHTVTFGSRH